MKHPMFLSFLGYRAEEQIYMFNVRAGSHNLTDPAPSEVEYEIEEIIVHPDYNAITIDNDIALMKIRQTIVMTDEISEVCLPEQGEMHVHGDEAWATGWGTSMGTADNRALQQVMLPFVDNTICNTIHEGEVTENMLCAGYIDGHYDTCSGDSGGPLVRQDPVTLKWVLYGLTSWGYGCADQMSPGVYTKVSNYVNWVNQKMYQNP
uniref:Cationic trypsin-3-like n=1 Tax=Saccoglossus kowalevskii TaxID=10224 RepID=A0ABM0MCT2_SACKO|nr:PREDICTED: cationic trypsin-3-like [Saccoglossus kowalevskii]